MVSQLCRKYFGNFIPEPISQQLLPTNLINNRLDKSRQRGIRAAAARMQAED